MLLCQQTENIQLLTCDSCTVSRSLVQLYAKTGPAGHRTEV